MPEPLKNMFSQTFYTKFIEQLQPIYPINSDQFFSILFDSAWEQKELKERLQHTAFALNQCIKGDYTTKIDIITAYIHLYSQTANSNWMLNYMFFPQFIEMYGLHDYKTSIAAIETITQLSSCEFAIRPFIEKYPEQTMQQMHTWAYHSHEHVRRLASEGCRPRLPWAKQLTQFRLDPSPIIPILDALKHDNSMFVRKSVANNIHDISKDNPQIALELCKRWKQNSKTYRIIQHGLRTLLKQGNTTALELCNFQTPQEISCTKFAITSSLITPLKPLEFTCEFAHYNKSSCVLRIEYCIYFLRSNGNYHKKVFRLKQSEFTPNTPYVLHKKHSFKPLTTRKHYSGIHYISIQINGKEFEKHAFNYNQ
ncbi:MAG TPA: DNA alkylation repair protein [Bacteroidales bacterium]|jgi:3-methyladenine DNA glycosylase AlkC|nr:DNA alkylation repair protein [Bacteroidales bacterium]